MVPLNVELFRSQGISTDPRGNVRRQLVIGFIATISSITQGTTLSLSSGSWFASLYSLGYLSGALIGGFQSDFFGRRRSMMIDNTFAIIGAAIIATANSFYMLLIGRYISGYAVGSCIASLPVYLSEISHPKVRGTLTAVFGAMYYAGTFVLMALGALLPWRIVVGICGSVPFITITGLFFCPESPIWLLRHGKKDEAIRVLVYFRGSQEAANEELISMENNLKKAKMHHDEEMEPTFLLTVKHHIKDLRKPTFWKPFALIMFLLPVVQNWSGMPFISFYMVSFIDNMKIPMDPYVASSILCFIRLIFGISSVKLLTVFSKKKMYLKIFMTMIFSNSSIALHQYLFEEGYFKAWGIADTQFIRWLPFALIMLLYGSVSLGYGSITRTLQGELLPANKRSLGCGIIGFSDGLSIFFVVKISPALSELIHVYGCFAIFVIALVFGAIVAYIFSS
ncbi:SLC2A6 [Lepeophtheirus salmonis]|uniref:SLC2A6 n=1 Tax=Lepeophtheirus salmonis TaxID=72036 RepID=A0A7R8CGB4_LEPSM|nr:SLC2A6 [Lepeophtheirus salmonis]CAF2757427.1 SLC2A6 [Lepeophtheirus salmonis]